MRVRVTLGIGLIVSGLLTGCGDNGAANQMNPGTVEEGADAAKAGLQGAGGGDMKKIMVAPKKGGSTVLP